MASEIEVKRGTKFVHFGGHAKVLVVSDGYAMARCPRAMPFVISVKNVQAAIAIASAATAEEVKKIRYE